MKEVSLSVRCLSAGLLEHLKVFIKKTVEIFSHELHESRCGTHVWDRPTSTVRICVEPKEIEPS